jgi:opacity protein-like surface antigen
VLIFGAGFNGKQTTQNEYSGKYDRKGKTMHRTIRYLIFVLLIICPCLSHAKDQQNYITLKPGMIFFTGDIKHEHPSGFYSELGFGHFIHPNIALEGGVGYFHDGVSHGNDIRGVPVTVTIKGVYPMQNFQPFVGGGVGLFFTKYEGILNGIRVHDRDTVLGGHVLIGADVRISRVFFVGFEGRYLITSNANYDGVKVNLNGFAPMLRIGVAF